MFHPVLRAGVRRHAPPGAPAGTLLACGLVAAALFGAAAPAAAEPGNDAWYRLRVCESGNNYRADTGNGYYGAYQFSLGTWHAYGGAGLPSTAAPADQDYRAKLLYRASGWAPWPACSRRLGLRGDPAYGRTGAAPARAAAPRVTHATPATPTPRVHHRRPVTARHRQLVPPTRHRPVRPPPTRHRPARIAVWSAPDGGRWGRPAAMLVPGSGHRIAAVRLRMAAFGRQVPWIGIVRPL
jgi:hypothetical protein